MQLILLQKVRNLGDLGDEVKVRSGYGRNYLIPQGMALAATKANVEVFEQHKSELLAASKDREAKARGRAEAISGKSFTVAMRASDEGKLYGSVGPQEIVDVVTAEGYDLDPSEVILAEGAIRQTGYYEATLSLHAEVAVEIEVVVAQLTDTGVVMPTIAPAAEVVEPAAVASGDNAGEAYDSASEPVEIQDTDAADSDDEPSDPDAEDPGKTDG